MRVHDAERCRLIDVVSAASEIVSNVANRNNVVIDVELSPDLEVNLQRSRMERVFENLGLALGAAGATFADIVKFGVYVTDMSILPVVREVRDRHIDPAQPPASTAVQVAALFRPGYLVEIDALAVVQDKGDDPAAG